MELGYDAVLNTAGALAAAAEPMEPRDMAVPSTPLPGRPFS